VRWRVWARCVNSTNAFYERVKLQLEEANSK
jgi:hypothetical protein